MQNKQKIAVIGGGITGIAACLELAKKGDFEITLFEKEENLGGLSTWFDCDGVIWDKYYHVVLSTDSVTLAFISELGLEDQIFWRETKTGFYGQGKLVPMSTTLDFLRFPFMSLWQKFRMGLGIIYSARVSNSSRLDKIFAREWLTKVFGRRVYENIWEPLLRSKLGDAREKTSALFIWATIQRLYGARQGQSKKEQMGHIRGGYYTILQAATKKLEQAGVTLRTAEPVLEVQTSPEGHAIVTRNGQYTFDKAIFTTDCPTTLNLLRPATAPYWENLAAIDYLSVFCVVFILSRKLSPYYVINLLDKDLPFTGIIEPTNIISPEDTDGKHIVFLPKYAPATDSIHNCTNDEIMETFTRHLKNVFPDLEDSHILQKKLHKTRYVQPIQALEYQQNLPTFSTPIPGIYVVNTSMIINSTLNNNTAISLAKRCISHILSL